MKLNTTDLLQIQIIHACDLVIKYHQGTFWFEGLIGDEISQEQAEYNYNNPTTI